MSHDVHKQGTLITELIEEQTKKILEHAYHAPHESKPSHESHESHEFIEKQTEYLAHKLHEQNKFIADI